MRCGSADQARVAERRHIFKGHLRELVDYGVARAVLRLLRERTDAEIVCTEISNDALWLGCPVEKTITLMPVLREYEVSFVEDNLQFAKQISVTDLVVAGPDLAAIDMLKAMKVWKEVGFDGPMIPDHLPHVRGDSDYQHRVRAHAVSYMKALMMAADACD